LEKRRVLQEDRVHEEFEFAIQDCSQDCFVISRELLAFIWKGWNVCG
jgi:hypothetical protein